jgi:hypothetical protein
MQIKHARSLIRAVLVSLCVVVLPACETPEERGARENAELDRKVKKRMLAEDRKRAARSAAAEAKANDEAETRETARQQDELDRQRVREESESYTPQAKRAREQFIQQARAKLEQGKYGIVGLEGDTLLIDEWLASYCNEVVQRRGPMLAEARKLGFKRFRCQGNNYRSGTVETVLFDL